MSFELTDCDFLLRIQVYSMVKYAQDVRTCRHQMFDLHFSKHLSTRLPPCGVCDNCVLAGLDVVTEDIKEEVRALCVLVDRLKSVNERVTLNKLVEAWRGVGSLRAIAKVARDECGTTVAAKRANKDVRKSGFPVSLKKLCRFAWCFLLIYLCYRTTTALSTF